MPAKKSKKSRKSIITWKNLSLFLILLIILTLFAFFSGILQQKYKEKTLKKFYADLVEAERSFNREAVYDSLTYEQRRLISLEEFTEVKDEDRRPTSMDFTVHSYRIDGDRGLIDRTLVACFTEECVDEDRFEQRATKEYLYINGKWYTPSENDTDGQGNIVNQNWPTESDSDGR